MTCPRCQHENPPRSRFCFECGSRLTASTLELVEGFIDVKALGPVPGKGLANPVEIFEVTGMEPARTRLQASARRGLTRFVGVRRAKAGASLVSCLSGGRQRSAG